MNTRHGKEQDRKFGTIIASYLFVLPAFVIVFVLVILAALNTFRLAFTDSTLLRPGEFVEFENFIKLFHDEYFLTALLNSAIHVIYVVPFTAILPLILAYLVKGSSRIMGFFCTTFYMPVVMFVVVVGTIWASLLGSAGLVSSVLKALKIIFKPIPFLADRWGVLFSSMFMTIWLGLGYYMVIYLAALANINESLYETVSLDGAGPICQFIYVTIPGVHSTMMLIIMLSIVTAFRVFNEIYMSTNSFTSPGGMGTTISMLIKREDTNIQACTGYMSATSIVMLVIVGVMLIVQQIVRERGEDW